MTKYYRVRTQEQWDWLVNRFGQSETQWPEQGMSFEEIRECLASGGFVIVHNDYFPGVGSVPYTATPQNNGNVIEVSDLMEDEKMEDYVTISRDDLFQIEDQDGEGIVQVDGKGEFSIPDMPIDEISIPKSLLYPKVRMSVVEKKEFGELKNNCTTLYEVLHDIDYEKEPKLYSRLFIDVDRDRNDSQLEFARAWVELSLIEVILDKKWNVKVPISHERDYYCKTASISGTTVVTERVGNGSELWTKDNFQFTAEELKQYGLDNDLFEKVEVRLEKLKKI